MPESPSSPKLSNEKEITYNFYDMLLSILVSKHSRRGRRLNWENKNIYLTIQNEKLMIFDPKNKKLHPLIVSTGDILGTDWIIIK